MKKYDKNIQGQTLITLLFFVIITITITTAAVIMIIIDTKATSTYEDATLAYYVAESGAENAILRLLRDPNYIGETLPVGSGSATILVTGGSSKTITSTGTLGNFTRKIQVQVQYTDNILSINSWNDIP